jgi:drug/metabolite transporter (DMT)-like permease
MIREPTKTMWNSAWVLLILANLFWAGNIVLGRGLAGHVPPIALAYWRWTGAFLIAFGFAWPYVKQDARVLLRHWRMMMLLSATGIATYNTMSYIGLTDTTALNVLLLQSAGPLVIILWAFALFGERPTVWQSAGVLLSLIGVATIAAHGSFEILLHLSINRGDVWILVAMVIYGVYAAMFRRRPVAHPLSFLVAMMGIGSMMILPFYVWETAEGGRIEGGLPSWLAMAYIAVFPSFIAYLFFNRGIELIGAARAGQSWHLMPVFGSILAVLFLGETFYAYHAIGIALIAGGIVLASIKATGVADGARAQRNVKTRPRANA